ncbi:MAG: 4Fe-4S binding protein [Deltaproteobacteria bacterium]|jgi:ferredoxin|nr:4Fe-4S binding protein [Deltaproteobacteria bacterium]NTV57001.1 4Fe-4S binding protein [Deltaproteobacteria bacterium]
MDHEIIKQVREWLEQGVVDLFLAYRITDGHPLPHVFTRDSIGEMKELVVGSALYPLEKIAWQLVRLHPEATVGLPVQEGDQRALKVLQAWNQIEERRIKVLPVAAAPSLQEKVTGKVKKALGIAFHADLRDLDRLEPWERFSRWMYEFQKCIKCYGCRNICPVCFCTECSLENADLVGTGRLPPEVPLFHLVRAVHMAGRCTDCGLCEEACPAEIPLRVLYRKVNEIVKEVFGYETGAGSNLSPLNLLGKEVTLEPKPI